MEEIPTASINSFGPMPEASVVPPEEPVFILTARQLQEVITRAIRPLEDELSKLRADQARDREEMAALIEAKREENIQEFNGIYKSLMLHRGKLDELSNPKKQPGTEKTASHLDSLETHLRAQKKLNRPASINYVAAGKLLGLSRRRVSQLRPIIERDSRFLIHVSGKKTLICLR